MSERIDLDALQAQLGPLINDRKVTEMDLRIAQTLALLDIAESLRIISTHGPRTWRGGPR